MATASAVARVAVDAVGDHPDAVAGDRGVGGDLVGAELGDRDHEPGPLGGSREPPAVEVHPAASERVGHHERRRVVHGDDEGDATRRRNRRRRRVHQVDGRDAPGRARDAEHVPRVVEHRRREREDHRIETVEVLVAQRAFDLGVRRAGR